MTKPLDPHQRYGLGRLVDADSRDAAFPMAAVLATDDETAYPERTTPWETGPVLQQGATSSCTGHAAAAWLMAEPMITRDGPDPLTIYAGAQARDPWAATPHDGSTVRAAMQMLQDGGRVRSYLWASDINTVSDWLLRRGTVLVGTSWYRAMFTPTDEGMIRIDGPSVGGHAYHLVWFDKARGLFRIQNSWGVAWGQGGYAWIDGADLQRLLNENGEACAPTENLVALPEPAVQPKRPRRPRAPRVPKPT